MLYNHMYSLCFTVENENEDGDATKEELFAGVLRRLSDLAKSGDEILEACLPSIDTYEVD